MRLKWKHALGHWYTNHTESGCHDGKSAARTTKSVSVNSRIRVRSLLFVIESKQHGADEKVTPIHWRYLNAPIFWIRFESGTLVESFLLKIPRINREDFGETIGLTVSG